MNTQEINQWANRICNAASAKKLDENHRALVIAALVQQQSESANEFPRE